MKCKSSWIAKPCSSSDYRRAAGTYGGQNVRQLLAVPVDAGCVGDFDQLFPVLPLEGLDQVPERRAVLLDITCDSDGAIDHYIDGDGIATTMPMPEYDPENPPMLGFFMVGAYQEILGNMHNLFGDTEAVDVFVFPDGSVEVELSDEGDTVADMLQYVQLDPKTLLTQFRDQVKKTDLDAELQQQFLEEFEAGLYGYTYLEDE